MNPLIGNNQNNVTNGNTFFNPTQAQMMQVLRLCNGRNPQEVFYDLCNQKGVNPDEFIKQIKETFR